MNSIELGLCSVTFRKNSAAQVVLIAKKAGVSYIEWGGDIHVTNIEDARIVKSICDNEDIKISSYGSYFNSAEYDEEKDAIVIECGENNVSLERSKCSSIKNVFEF